MPIEAKILDALFFLLFLFILYLCIYVGRIIAIDYGKKRTGLAVTDEQQRIATPLDTVPTASLVSYLVSYMSREPVEAMVIGWPVQLDGTPSETQKQYVEPAIRQLRKIFPDIRLETMDERFTSKMAFQSMIDGGLRKKDRRDKGTIDRVSAVILLQSYLIRQQMEAERTAAQSENRTAASASFLI